MKLIKFIILICCVTLPATSFAATYYANSSRPDDSGDGTSWDRAKKTLAAVRNLAEPGDTVCFKGIFREQLTPNSGSPQKVITWKGVPISAGNPSIVDGADLLQGWSLDSGAIYKVNYPYNRKIVLEDGVRLNKVKSKNGMTPGTWFWNDTSKVAFVWTRESDDPSNHLMEISSRISCINVNQKSNLMFTNFMVRGSDRHGITLFASSADVKNITFQNVENCYNAQMGYIAQGNPYWVRNLKLIHCNTHHNGWSGAQINTQLDGFTAQYSNFDFNASIADTNFLAGLRINGKAIQTGDRTCKNILVDHCYARNNGMWQGKSNGKEGTGFWLDTVSLEPDAHNIIRYCWASDNNINGIHLENDSYVKCYYNISINNGKQSATTSSGYGILCDASPPVYGYVQFNDLFNNVCYGNGNAGLGVVGIWPPTVLIGGCMGNEVRNNICINNSLQQTKLSLLGCQLRAAWGGENDGTRGMENVYTNNCFGSGNTGFINWGTKQEDTYHEWEQTYGGSTFSVESPPDLTNPGQNKFTLNPDSLCIGAGVNVGLNKNFAGEAVTNPPNAGAY